MIAARKPRLKNYTNLVRKCSNQGIAICEVPADGDCMAWSLRTLYLGYQNVGRFDTAEAKNEVSLIRRMMGSAWEMVSGELWWQTLFDAFCADRLRQNEPAPETPKKQKKGDSLGNEDRELATPPRPDPPGAPGKRKGEPDTTGVETPPRPDAQATSLIEATGKPEGPKRAEGAKPVPMVSKDVNAPQQLMQPQRKCARTLQEPEAPDMEEAFHQIMMAPKKRAMCPCSKMPTWRTLTMLC